MKKQPTILMGNGRTVKGKGWMMKKSGRTGKK